MGNCSAKPEEDFDEDLVSSYSIEDQEKIRSSKIEELDAEIRRNYQYNKEIKKKQRDSGMLHDHDVTFEEAPVANAGFMRYSFNYSNMDVDQFDSAGECPSNVQFQLYFSFAQRLPSEDCSHG